MPYFTQLSKYCHVFFLSVNFMKYIYALNINPETFSLQFCATFYHKGWVFDILHRLATDLMAMWQCRIILKMDPNI
jgi:hypothetical protein